MVAAGRAGRPGAWLPEIEPVTDEELDRCPFCGGREDRTPPEVLRLGGDPWRVRVVPNLYPAFDRQEVVIHSPDHVRSFAEVPGDHVPLIAQAWLARAKAFAAEGVGDAMAFVNEGRVAGASLAHSHSQLVALREVPAAEAEHVEELGSFAGFEDLAVAERDDVIALVHPHGTTPYECLIVPRGWTPDPFGGERALVASLILLRDLVARFQRAEGRRPWNAWFHRGNSDGYFPHAHFVPRLTALAGLELGAGLYVNVVPPQVAAEALRA